MAEYLLDTSALVKYYHPEVGSSRVIALVDDPGNVSYLSRLTLIEIHSVFARLVREGQLDERGLRGWQSRFYADLRARRFRVVRSSPVWEREAIRLLMRQGVRRPLRTLDALQLAVALWLRDQGRLDGLVCADRRLETVAQAEGVPVINPEQP